MKYELTFLVNDLNESKNIKTLIESIKGKVIKEEDWGEKTLAYAINKLNRARFYNFVIEISRQQVSELKKKLNFNEKIIRYLLLIIS